MPLKLTHTQAVVLFSNMDSEGNVKTNTATDTAGREQEICPDARYRETTPSAPARGT
jgi:hypothetical protein